MMREISRNLWVCFILFVLYLKEVMTILLADWWTYSTTPVKTFWVIQWVLIYPMDSAVCIIWTTGPDGRINWTGPFQAKRHLKEENVSQFWLITAPYVTVFNYIYILTLIYDNTARLG